MKKLQQLLCLLLCLVFCLALLPAAALAEDADEDTGAIALVEDPAGEGTIAPATEPETLPAPGDEPNAGDVAINAANFPDANFREFVKQYDKDSNGYLSTAELAEVTSMDCGSKSIADLTGVEHFTALKRLYCYSNDLTSLDLSNNTALTKLTCYDNQLTSLDLSNNTALTELTCYDNQLTELDVSNNTELTFLDCEGNQLTFLDLSAVPALKDAVENGTRDTSNSAYDWYYSSWGTLYVDKTVTIITDPTGLGVAINPANFPDANFRAFVKRYDTDSNGFLSTAELAAVMSMSCSSKNIADLKGIEHFTALTWLGCYDNQLTSLDLSNNTALTYLRCYNNQLTSLDLSGNTALKTLWCYNNQLTELDVSNNTALTDLECDGNQLTFLDLSAVPALKDAVENGTRDTSNSAYDWYSS